MLRKLIPQDEGYFEVFNQLTRHIVASAGLLRDYLAKPQHRAQLLVQIKTEEHRADEVMANLGKRIHQSFVTPIDREDIHLLASKLDDVVDVIDSIARRCDMLRIGDAREPALRQAEILVQATGEIAAMVAGMKQPAVVTARATEIKRLEEEADACYHAAVGELFAHPENVLEVVRWKDIYETLEKAVDICHHVSTIIQSISLKHS
jgi:predicted phosphate transport protein (TIGR00153 family)